ncbi:unnamed protein product [Cyprideis torosa]|uniref:Uncharacterized protein n=1 Tax=Cyprideis torosa TaxID=163714 RepID=A0A7R8ZWY7_9CRUS|nr:unnamed protein product [Cyprideis torosa]CAG0906216.1 unnamed protein product [Cyprideis torosa]
MKTPLEPLPESDVTNRYLDQLRLTGFEGDIESSLSSRLVMATDNSIYQQLPVAVLFPKSTEDVQCIVRIANRPQYRSLTFAPRGGGTGTNGQSLTSGVVVDLSRHMTAVLELDVKRRRVRVQAGLVKDTLNDVLRPHGLFFSPDLSTSNRAVIGGMISTDASGQGSLRYGKTSDHVLGLRCVLMDAEVLDTRPMTLNEAVAVASGDGIAARATEQLLQTVTEHATEIDARFPDLNRFLTGYDLKHALTEEAVDLGRLICGSEGTLGFITEAWLDLDEIPKSRTLVNINYDSFNGALRAAPELLRAEALSVETVDSTVLKLARADVVWNDVSEDIDDAVNPDILGLNLVEFAGQDVTREQAKVSALCAALDKQIQAGQSGVLGYRVCTDLDSIQRVYGMRKKSVGLLGNLAGTARPIPFVEDTCVPPEHLADYIAEFRALLDSKGLKYGMFGHVDCGVLHVRPALDLIDPVQQTLLREISDAVAVLTEKYGGLLWGEHGRGHRSEYGPMYFGETVFAELRKIKAAFDPHNRLNPGKICTPWSDEDEQPTLVSVDGPLRGEWDRQISPVSRSAFEGPLNCNGNGLCFNYDTASPMCPTYKATSDRRHSPKGRATLLREWLRRQSTGDSDADFESQVAEALRGCLACKACSSACPVKVDIPRYRSEFFHQYYQRKRRPLKDYLVAGVEYYGPWMAKFPRVMNALMLNPISRRMMPKLSGMTDLPRLSGDTETVGLPPVMTVRALEKLSAGQRENTVCIVADAFTLFYEAAVVADLGRLVSAMGKSPVMLPFQANGKPMHVKGFLKAFERVALTSSETLRQTAALSIPLVGVDPAMTLCFRDEYVKTLGNRRGEFEVLLPQEWLLSQPKMESPASQETAFTLLAHCTERALQPEANAQWQAVFAHFGLTLATPSSGCCGMSGSYGHETAHLATSRHIYSQDWAAKVSAGQHEVLATGYSCRSQVKRLGQQSLRHPVQVLLEVFHPLSKR